MVKILNVNEMLDAAHEAELPGVEDHVAALEAAADGLAQALASHLGIETSGTSFQGGFGGLCSNFSPAEDGQECPGVIDQGDPEGEWE